jgi:hypothetical protein
MSSVLNSFVTVAEYAAGEELADYKSEYYRSEWGRGWASQAVG